MGFFKDFKDDFSQAVNELMPGEEKPQAELGREDLVINTLEDEVDVESELSKLDGLLEQVMKQETAKETAQKDEEISVPEPEVRIESLLQPESIVSPVPPVPPVPTPAPEPIIPQAPAPAVPTPAPESEIKVMPMTAAVDTAAAVEEAPIQTQNITKPIQEEKKMADIAPVLNSETPVSDEVTVITEGTIIKGDVVSNGSLDIRGQVKGNVGCQGKLTVTGVVEGNSNASEFFADTAKVEGEVTSSGTVKIGLGSVIIGNVTSASAVIAGAIKGDIDVKGPVVVDTSAVVMGNIKSRSVQINNGAVIEGFCSQCYSDVDVESVFAEKKGTE